ncbi:MAG: hypothetical protein FJW40_05105 [Acidobacteria bacterium]|nr:hypothetical protein [Acidobacteriota bacterium]
MAAYLAMTGLLAQAPVPPPSGQGTFQIPGPPPETAPPPTESAKPAEPPAMVYAGKPLKLDQACTLEEVSSFGLHCSESDPCEIFLELSHLEAVGNKLFLTGNLHTEALTLQSILLVSEDAGKTWREGHQRLRQSGLENIQFIDFEMGWISGHTLHTMPRDPFLLTTTDGGKTWRKKLLFEDGHLGSVEQFFFDTKNTGSMIVDRTQASETGSRYELYESQTAGDTWTLRQVSGRPIVPRRTRPAVAQGVRLRADARSKSYLIERQAGARWQVVSAFQVRLDDCKPAEPVKEITEKEPDPPSEQYEKQAAPAAPKPAGPVKPPTLKKK